MFGGAGSRLLAGSGAGLLLLTACGLGGGSSGAGTSDSATGTRAPLATVKQVTVDGHRVATRCAGDPGDPPVLLVSGFDTPLGQSWDRLQPLVAGYARVCAYDRLGVGDSSRPPRRQRIADLASQLDGVLDAVGLKRPVTVVAHSLGGAIAVTWAEQHRQDVAGVVLVDATPPGYLREFLDRLPDGSSGDAGSVRDGIRALLSPRRNAEHLDVADLVEGPMTFAPLGATPVVALTHSISDFGADLKPKNAAALDSAWIGGQQGWADLSSAGRVQRVDQAGHFIQNDQPRAVADAVREVVTGQGG